MTDSTNNADTHFVNLTPHTIRLRADVSDKEAVPRETDIVLSPRVGADGKADPARVAVTAGGQVGALESVNLYAADTFGAPVGLPEPEEGVYLLVSAVVAGQCPREDVLALGTGPNDGAVRYADGPQKGQVFAVTRLKKTV